MSYLFNNRVSLNETDAFGKVRVSEPFTLADYSHVFGENPELITVSSGSGTTSHVQNQSSIRLQVGAGTNDWVIHQSRMYHHYMPGKSQLIYESFCFGTASTNNYKKIGYYDDRDGVYLQQSPDGVLSFVQRSYATGTQSEISVTQSQWNIDKCDGLGKSKFNINPLKTQLVFFDYQWLGVGRLRCGFVHNGELLVAHEFYHSNNLQTVYWSNPSLPIRCEIRNVGTGTTTCTMDQICASVISEGGYEGSGIDFAKSTDLRTIATASFQLPSIAIRLKNTFNGYPNRTTVRPGQVDILGINNNIKYEIWRLPNSSSITGGSWVSAGDDSSVEYNITGTGWTSSGGNLFSTGFIGASTGQGQGASKAPVSENLQSITTSKRGYISQNFDSTGGNIFVIVVTALSIEGGSSTCDFRASIQWRETR